MLEQKKGEDRLEFLARVLFHFMNDTHASGETIDYDGTTCDGYCLAQDFMDELGLDEADF